MELSGTLLVAIMFTTVVGLSIGGLLITLANFISTGIRFASSGLFLGWAIYLLLLHLSLFWDTSAITRIDDWQFGGLLLIVSGPMLLLLTTQVLISDAQPENPDDGYLAVARKFQISLALLHGWMLVAIVSLAHDDTLLSVRSMLLIGISVCCAIFTRRVVQVWLCALAWVVTILPALLFFELVF